VNIPDCYGDDRFDQTFDKMTGYRTNNLLTMSIVDFEGECMGVLQAINKNPNDAPSFSRIDEILMENLTQHVCIALRNAEVYRAAIITSERASALLHMIQALSSDLGVQSMILTTTMHANELVQADRCTVFLVDEKKQQLWSVSTDSGKEIRIPKTMGIAGECAMEGKLIAIPEAYEDKRFNQKVDLETGYRTRSILAVPVLKRSEKCKVMAVIQMINKTEFDGEIGKFDDEDIQVMETFATFVASKLEHSTLLSKESGPEKSEAELAFDLNSTPSHKKRGSIGAEAKITEAFAEVDEEEEDA
jgi:adenylate cyclase